LPIMQKRIFLDLRRPIASGISSIDVATCDQTDRSNGSLTDKMRILELSMGADGWSQWVAGNLDESQRPWIVFDDMLVGEGNALFCPVLILDSGRLLHVSVFAELHCGIVHYNSAVPGRSAYIQRKGHHNQQQGKIATGVDFQAWTQSS